MKNSVWDHAPRATHHVKIKNKSVARASWPVALSVFILLLACFSSLYAEEVLLKTLSARVVKVAADGTAIDVDFKNPATEKNQAMTFVVDGQSGLSGISSLRELRTGQVVNIDYVEDPRNRLCIRRIARVKLSGPPAGLENFRGL